MMRKKLAVILAVAMVISTISITYASMNIVPDNNFVGEGIHLSLEQATEKLLTDSTDAKIAEINLKSAEAIAKSYDESLDAIENANNVVKESPIPVLISSSSVKSEIAKVTKDFAKVQGPLNYEAEINAMKIDVREKYFTVLQAADLVEIQKENVALQEETFSQTKKKYQLGLVAKNDLLKAELSIKTAKNNLSSYENNLKLAKMDLNSFLGYDIMEKIVLTDELEPLEGSEVQLATAIQLALENNNGIKAVEYAYELQKISFNGTKLRNSKTSSTYKSAEVSLLTAEQNIASTKDLVEIDTRSRYMNMIQGLADIETAQANVENSRVQVNSAELSYELGQATLLTVQQAQLALKNQQMALSEAILDYNLAVDQYNVVMTPGTITAPIR